MGRKKRVRKIFKRPRKIRKLKKIELRRRVLHDLILSESWKYYKLLGWDKPSIELEDFIQEALVQLYDAIDKYSIFWVPVRRKFVDGREAKDRKPASFNTFYVTKLRNRFKQMGKDASITIPEEDVDRIEGGGDTYSRQEWCVIIKDLEKEFGIKNLEYTGKILKGAHLRLITSILESLRK